MILGQTQKFASPGEALQHVSETPWSNWTKADYSVEQWHAACLIHLHDGAPTSKDQCKLPVKTPDGTLNRNGVHAAAAALAGARGGLKGVSADQKDKAAAALRRYYSQLDEEPPESLAQSEELISDILSHYGVKGMHWGVRKERARTLAPAIQGEIKRTTANGDELTLKSSPPDKFDKAMAFASQNYANRINSGARFKVQDKNGKKIGEANFFGHRKYPDAAYLNWITIEPSARGRGYASEILKAAEEHSRAAGKKRMVLEVPGNAPDARHIYEKMGFKVTKEPSKFDKASDSVWGGLTQMEKRLDD